MQQNKNKKIKEMKTQLTPKLPKLVCSKSGWRVVYYEIRNGKATRITIRVEHIRKWHKSVTEAKQVIEETIIKPISTKLLSLNFVGNISIESSNIGITFKELIETYSMYYHSQLAENSNTIFTYDSYLNNFKKYIEEKKLMNTNVNVWKKSDIEEYINSRKKRGIASSSLNVNIGFIKKMFAWAYEEEKIQKNIAENIKKIKNIEIKERKVFSDSELKKISDYLYKNDYNFYVYTQLVYSCFLRPVEIQRLQVKNIDFESKKIIIGGEKTKNHAKRIIVIPTNVWEKTIKFWEKIQNLNKEMYLFGDNFLPNKKQISNANTSTLRWNKVRKEIGLSEEYLLYGLRHTGITKLLENKNLTLNEVRMHAGHKSIQMTEHYGRHVTESMEEKFRVNITGF